MKIFRRIFKLFLPAWYMHRRLDKKFGIKVNPVSESKCIRFVVSLLPYFMSAILQQRKPTDRRVYKYFLPYGKMCDHIHAAYAKNVRNPQKDIGIWGKIRSYFPYGLILWWDNEDNRLAPVSVKPSPATKPVAKPSPAPSSNPMLVEMRNMRNDMTRMFQNMRMMQDRMEILSLRTLLGGKLPSASVVLTGRGDLNDLIATIGRLSNSSLLELQIIIAADMPIAAVNENINPHPGVSIEYVETTGLSLSEVYNLALKKATGDYIGFLEVGDYYSTDDMLEYLMLRALNERAQVYGGSVAVNWKNPRVGLSSVIFNRKWLISSGLEVCFNVRNNDGIFIRCAKALADHSVILQRSVVNHVPLKYEINYTEQERKEDILNTLLNVSRAVKEVKGKEVLAQEVEKIIKDNIDVIRNLVWQRGVIQKDKADIVKELASNIGKPEVAEDILNPLVSFIIPVYNAEKELARCLLSILRISIKNIEIICVDDGSTDRSFELLKSFAESDSRIKIYTQENSGQGEARNKGIKFAKGRYIQFVDADDFIDSSMYPKVLTPFNSSEVLDFVQFSATVHFDFKPTAKQEEWGRNLFRSALPTGIYDVTPQSFITTVVWNKVYRRSFLIENNIWFPAKVKQEDEAFSFFVFARAKKFYCFADKWYRYVRTQTGTMSTQETQADFFRMPDVYAVFQFILEFLLRERDLKLLGFFYKRVIGATTRFNDTPIMEQCRDCAAYLLQKADFGAYRDLLIRADKAQWLQRLGYEFYTRDVTIPPQIPNLEADFPLDVPVIERCKSPKLSYIVLMDAYENFIVSSLQSLADQQELDIEVICVTTEKTSNSISAVEKFSRRDRRFTVKVLDSGFWGDKGAQLKAALTYTSGEFVVIHEGKNILPLNHARECLCLSKGKPDIILIPDEYFDAQSHNELKQYWMYASQSKNFPSKDVWNFEDCDNLSLNLDTNHHCFRSDFLKDVLRDAPGWKVFANALLLHLLNSADKISIAKKTKCLIRFGNLCNEAPMSAETKKEVFSDFVPEMFFVVKTAAFAQRSIKAKILLLHYVLDKLLWMFDRMPSMKLAMQKEFKALPDYLVRSFAVLKKDVWDRFWRTMETAKEERLPIPEKYREELMCIEKARSAVNQDTYIVISFLLDAYAECIDSWSFFVYLKEKGIRAKYIIPAYSEFYKKVVAPSKWNKDVLTIKDDSSNSYEILDVILPHLYRTKAIVMEDGYLPNGLSEYFKNMDRLLFCLCGHGVIYIWLNSLLQNMTTRFNAVNTCGHFEKLRFVDYFASIGKTPPFALLEGGFPRFDALKVMDAHRSSNECTVLVSLSWRNDFKSEERLRNSVFFKRLSALLKDNVWEMLRQRGVSVVMAIHHAMRRELNNAVDFGSNIKVVDPMEISEYIRKSDCLITDLSSLAFDFIYQHKPVIFWIPDVEDYELSYVSRSKITDAAKMVPNLSCLAKSIPELSMHLLKFADKNFQIDADVALRYDKLFFKRGHNRERLYNAIEKQWEDEYIKGN